MIGFNMLQGDSTHQNQGKAYSPAQQQAALSIAVSPLAMPILAGPGTIATAMNFATTGGFDQTIITIVSFAVLVSSPTYCSCLGTNWSKR